MAWLYVVGLYVLAACFGWNPLLTFGLTAIMLFLTLVGFLDIVDWNFFLLPLTFGNIHLLIIVLWYRFMIYRKRKAGNVR